jgi:hypothetical protein
VVIIIEDPACSSLYDGPVMTRVPIVGNPYACRQAPRVSTRAQDAIPDPQRTQVVTEYLFKIFLDFSNQDWFFPLGF